MGTQAYQAPERFESVPITPAVGTCGHSARDATTPLTAISGTDDRAAHVARHRLDDPRACLRSALGRRHRDPACCADPARARDHRPGTRRAAPGTGTQEPAPLAGAPENPSRSRLSHQTPPRRPAGPGSNPDAETDSPRTAPGCLTTQTETQGNALQAAPRLPQGHRHRDDSHSGRGRTPPSASSPRSAVPPPPRDRPRLTQRSLPAVQRNRARRYTSRPAKRRARSAKVATSSPLSEDAAGQMVAFVTSKGKIGEDYYASGGWHGSAALPGTPRAGSPIVIGPDGVSVYFIEPNGRDRR